MHSGVLLVACALCCVAAAHAARVPPARAPVPAAHRTRREGTHLAKCPEGMELDDGRCLLVIQDADPDKHLEAAKLVRAKRMIGMLPDRALHHYCPQGHVRLFNGECVAFRAPAQPGPDYMEYD